jgi:hypothetical protein
VVRLLGVPAAEHAFYPSVLGAVLVGIGVALIVEALRPPGGMVGLGLGGAVAINLCAGLVLAAWLLSGTLGIAVTGRWVLWGTVAVLVGISGCEIATHRAHRSRRDPG